LTKALISFALDLAAQGLPVFPVYNSKVPATPHGLRDATTAPEGVRDLFSRYHAPLIGVATGEVSGINVLDLDPRHGSDAWLQANETRLPTTRTHRTRSGGLHLLFKHAEGLRNSVGKIAPGCDVRADGGCAILWPADGLPITRTAPISERPEWLLRELQTSPARPPTSSGMRLLRCTPQ
jgi:hypothetical protein